MKGVYTGYFIRDNRIYGPEDRAGTYYIANNHIYGPSHSGEY